MSHNETWFSANRAHWDERVPIHVASSFYDVAGFKAGSDPLYPFTVAEVGEVRGKELVHLQCHFGQNTLAWARRGAIVTGLDFSPAAIDAARALAADCELPARFVEGNLYDAVEALGGHQYDIVYVDNGAIVWLPDIRGWARVAAACLRPRGVFYLCEGHPILNAFADETLTVTGNYFQIEPSTYDEPGSYADPWAATTQNRTYEWDHPIGEVVTALIDAGLRIEFLHEHDFLGWARWPFMVRNDEGEYRLPPGKGSLPLMYSIRASKDR